MQLLRSPRRELVARLRERLMALYRGRWVAADYPLGRTPEADPALRGNILTDGWCPPKL